VLQEKLGGGVDFVQELTIVLTPYKGGPLLGGTGHRSERGRRPFEHRATPEVEREICLSK